MRRERGRLIGDRIADAAFVLPAVGLAIAIFFYPTVNALWRGFTEWTPGLPSEFTGLENYRDLLTDETFHQVLRNSGIYLIGVPILVVVPLLVAFMLYERVPQARLFRTLLLFPLVLSPPILGLLFASILNPTNGLLNESLQRVGLGGLTHAWIDEPSLVKPTIIAVVLWGGMGVSVLIFHAALSAIPPDLFEAAELDGASWLRKVRDVMVPGIRPVLEAITALAVVSVFTGLIGLIQVLTNGGPNQRSASVDFDIYSRALQLQDYGSAAAEAGLLLVMVVVLVALLFGLRRVLSRPRRHPGPIQHDPLIDRLRQSSIARRAGRLRPGANRFRRRSTRRWSVFRLAIALVLAFLFAYPLLYLAGTAVKPQAQFNADPIGLPTALTGEFLRTAWESASLGRAMVNSLISVTIGVVICTVLSSLASFWFIRHTGRMRVILFAAMSVFYFVPVIVWVIPLQVTLARVGLTDNLLVLGVVYGAAQLPFGVALLTVYLSRGVPEEMLEAARVDGASLWAQYRYLIVPLSRPAIAALVPLVTAFLWGDLIIGLILIQDPGSYPATIAATQLVGGKTPSLQASAAASVISFFPLLVLFALSQRSMVRGITAGIGRV